MRLLKGRLPGARDGKDSACCGALSQAQKAKGATDLGSAEHNRAQSSDELPLQGARR